jgi:hypothetical protein
MKFIDRWLHRDDSTPTAADLRAEIAGLTATRNDLERQRASVALRACGDDTFARRHDQLTDGMAALGQRIALLREALPEAERRDAERAKLANAERQEAARAAYERETAAARKWLDGVLARLPDGHVLTEARDLRDRLKVSARELGDGRRRVLDPLDELVTAMQHRLDRVSRARWHDGPITIAGGASGDARAQAAERIGSMEGTKA